LQPGKPGSIIVSSAEINGGAGGKRLEAWGKPEKIKITAALPWNQQTTAEAANRGGESQPCGCFRCGITGRRKGA